MAKVTAPELSMNAAGQFAGLLIYTSRNGVPYVKFHATPHVTATKTQSGLRAVFSFLTKAWQTLSPDDQAYWASLVPDPHLTPAHLYLAAGQTSARLHNTWPAAPPDPDALPPGNAGDLAAKPLARAIRLTWSTPLNAPSVAKAQLLPRTQPNILVSGNPQPDNTGEWEYAWEWPAGYYNWYHDPTRSELAYNQTLGHYHMYIRRGLDGQISGRWHPDNGGPYGTYSPFLNTAGHPIVTPIGVAATPDYCIEIHRSLLPFDEAHPPTIHTLRAALPYTAEQILDTGLTSGQTYHYALRYQNRTGIHGDIQTITEEPT